MAEVRLGEVGGVDCSLFGVVWVEDSALFTPVAREWSRKERLDLETDFPAPYLDEKLSP